MFNRIQCGYAGSNDWKRCEEERIVTSEERLRELEEKYEGYKVYDNQGEKIGKVDDLFIDEADREEYIGVKMGLLGRKSTLIPMDIVRVNEADKTIEVSESKDHVKDAPSFDDDEDITPEYEERIRSHFGLESQGSSRTRGSYGAYGGDRETSSAAGAEYGERETSETPVTRETEETETFEEGGRAKVRRRIIREEVVEEDQDSRS
jgi:PRC-barrel domain